MIAFVALLVSTTFGASEPPVGGAVVDAKGHPVAGVEVVVSPGQSRDGTVPIVAETRSDEAGRFTFDRQAVATCLETGTLWALKPGLGLGMDDLVRDNQTGTTHRIVLESPQARTLTIVDAVGKPLVGARVAPRLVQTSQTRHMGVLVPDAWLSRLGVTTDSAGHAPLPALTRLIDLRTVHLRLPGPRKAAHVVSLPFAESKAEATLTLGAPRMMSGRVTGPAAAPVAGATVEVWARGAIPIGPSRDAHIMPERVQTGGDPIHTRADGTFETPPMLMVGKTYRVVVRRDGYAPAMSDWIKLSVSAAAPLAVELRPLMRLEGRVADRQANPVPGALVFQPGDGPETTSDDAGRFVLEKARPDLPFLLVSKPGFRFHGVQLKGQVTSPIDLVLTRQAEPPDRSLATLSDRLPREQSQALARRVLEPILKDELARGEDAAKAWLPRVFR